MFLKRILMTSLYYVISLDICTNIIAKDRYIPQYTFEYV